MVPVPSSPFNNQQLLGMKLPAAVSTAATSLPMIPMHRRKLTTPIAATKSPSSA